jgi:hypothetical protein
MSTAESPASTAPSSSDILPSKQEMGPSANYSPMIKASLLYAQGAYIWQCDEGRQYGILRKIWKSVTHNNADGVYNRHDDMKDLRCMSFTSRGSSEILIAGWQDQMFTIDVEKGTVTKQVKEPKAISDFS